MIETSQSQASRQIARRSGAEFVPWRETKLTTLIGNRLGANALVRVVATVKNGSPKQSLATLKLASTLREVTCYPVLNTGTALGLAHMARSELVSLAPTRTRDGLVMRGLEMDSEPPEAVLEVSVS